MSQGAKPKSRSSIETSARCCMIDGRRRSHGSIIVSPVSCLRRLHSAPDTIAARSDAFRLAASRDGTHDAREAVHRKAP
jgi:hypothetical protein